MVINNVEIPDIDVADARIMERYEAAHDKVAEKMNGLDVTGKRRSELIRIQCGAVFGFFEDVFGEGTAEKVFGESVNLTTCLNAYEAVVNEVNRLDKKIAEQYKATRQFRRYENHHKGKNKKPYGKRPYPVK